MSILVIMDVYRRWNHFGELIMSVVATPLKVLLPLGRISYVFDIDFSVCFKGEKEEDSSSWLEKAERITAAPSNSFACC